jgi:hypothetical protein
LALEIPQRLAPYSGKRFNAKAPGHKDAKMRLPVSGDYEETKRVIFMFKVRKMESEK